MLPSLLGSFMHQPRRVGLQRVVEFEGGNLVVAFDGNLFDLSQDERAFVNKIVDRCEQQPAVEPRRRRTWFGRFVDRFKL
jgi:hypothetical protein